MCLCRLGPQKVTHCALFSVHVSVVTHVKLIDTPIFTGTGGDVLILEEAAYCDEGFFYEVSHFPPTLESFRHVSFRHYISLDIDVYLNVCAS